MPIRLIDWSALWLCVSGFAIAPSEAASPSGNATIRGGPAGSKIIITTTNRLAGVIHSLTWGGEEFIDSADHGRQLQSAAAFDCARPGEFWAECYNPTEAGSRRDGAGDTSTSRLLSLTAADAALITRIRMAFWLAPGEDSSGRPALNHSILSGHIIAKRVHIGYRELPRVIDYRVTFTVPPGEKHTLAQFEALTGYMPPKFSRFWEFRPGTGKLEPLDDGPGEQADPVILATESGSHAMGVYSPDQPARGFEGAGYGRFRFVPEKVVKWNCVFRVRDSRGVAPGNYHYRMFVPVGTLEDVRRALESLNNEFRRVTVRTTGD